MAIRIGIRGKSCVSHACRKAEIHPSTLSPLACAHANQGKIAFDGHGLRDSHVQGAVAHWVVGIGDVDKSDETLPSIRVDKSAVVRRHVHGRDHPVAAYAIAGGVFLLAQEEEPDGIEGAAAGDRRILGGTRSTRGACGTGSSRGTLRSGTGGDRAVSDRPNLDSP